MIKAVIATVFGLSILLFSGSVYADARLGPNAPLNANSEPVGGHVFFLRSNENNGAQKEIRLHLYYPKGTNVGAQSMTLSPQATLAGDDVCNAVPKKGAANNKFVQVIIADSGQASNNNTYNIDVSNVCKKKDGFNGEGNNANNRLYAKYRLPGGPTLDPKTDMLKYDVTIQYGYDVPADVHNRARIKVNTTGNSLISQGGQIPGNNDTYTFPIIADYNLSGKTNNTKINIPFGFCQNSNDRVPVKIGMYDADQWGPNTPPSDRGFPGSDIRYRIWDRINNRYVSFEKNSNGTTYSNTNAAGTANSGPEGDMIKNGSLGPDLKLFHPSPNTNKAKSFGTVYLQKNLVYEMQILDLNPGNTVDVSLPTETVSPEICSKTWAVSSAATINGVAGTVEVAPGTKVRYAYTMKNASNATVPSTGVKQTINWSAGANTGVYKAQAAVPNIDPNQTIKIPAATPNYYEYTIPSNAAAGSLYCQQLSYVPKTSENPATGLSNQVCAKVKVSTSVVTITGKVDNPQVETKTSPQFKGGAVVSNFPTPTPGGWGYNQKAIRKLADPVTGNATKWTCSYPQATDPAYRTETLTSSTRPSCSFRCNAGSGDPAYNNNTDGVPNWTDKTGILDQNCYVKPSFNLTCKWGDLGTTAVTVVVTYPVDDTVCEQTLNRPAAGAVGSAPICATMTITNPTGWSSAAPLPGAALNSSGAAVQLQTWSFSSAPGTGCESIVGYPYLKVYGGDVRVGGGVGAKQNSCLINDEAKITARARTSGTAYIGSGVQISARAGGMIDGFVTGQYNQYYNAPKGLSIANTDVSSAYGGLYDKTPFCTGFVDQQSAPIVDLGANIFTMNGQSGTLHSQHVGDVKIRGNVTYSNTGWTIGSIPDIQIVVVGNIYISGNVTQLDGMYVAVPDAQGNGGNIYTCVNPADLTVPTTTFANCGRQLVVNGSLAANHIYFYRDCGSLSYSTVSESIPTGYTGGTDKNSCTPGGSGAAEIINYSATQWLSSVVPGGNGTYDAITSLPPVL